MSTRDSEEAKGPPVVGQRFRHKHVGPMAYFFAVRYTASVTSLVASAEAEQNQSVTPFLTANMMGLFQSDEKCSVCQVHDMQVA